MQNRLAKGLRRVSVTSTVVVNDSGEIVHWQMDAKSSPKGPFMRGGADFISKAKAIGIELVKATYNLDRMKTEAQAKKRGGVQCDVTTPHVESISVR